MMSPRWVVAGIGLIVVVLAATGWAVWYRGAYHLWPGQSIPPRIHWCGRDYDRGSGPAVSHAEVVRLIGPRLRAVAQLPPAGPRHDLVAATTEQEVRGLDPDAPGCATLTFLRLGPSRYLVYELQGSL